MIIDEEDYIAHIGTPRHSGRYPWGSGDNPYQRNKSLLAYADDLKKKGMTEKQIADGMGMTTTQLRALKAIAKAQVRAEDQAQAKRYHDKGMSNVAIGERMGINESSVRALLNPATQDKLDVLETTANMLKDQVAAKDMIQIGVGVENQLGISPTKLSTAVAMLKEEGYRVDTVKVQQLGTGKFTEVKVLSKPGTEYKDIIQNKDKIRLIEEYSEDGGRTYTKLEPPVKVNPKRIEVRFKEDGGDTMDGVIELRRGVDDISLGGSRYAQVRIAVEGDKYLKGMAMYSDDLPDGVDIRFNTNKSSAKTDKLGAMKDMKSEESNATVFGSIVRQRHYTEGGKKKLSALNIVGTEDPDGVKRPGEEGAWYEWSRNLSSQMMSKQPPSLAKQQLDLAYQSKRDTFEEINALTNPAVKKRLLKSFADDADAAAVHLKAAGLPRTRNHVLLPINSLKDTEIYAPQYKNGEKVVLIRHPHGGRFEIPELTVNNRNKDANRLIQNAKDAVGINSRVAARLSGADFDGDTALVIPNNRGQVKTKSPLAGLKDFDPQAAYPRYDGMKLLDNRTKQRLMGDVSNLITDMTIRGANDNELAAAVRHSMVVIDAEKHKLNYKQSHQDNGIAALKKKYQGKNGQPGKSNSGASTVISSASSRIDVPDRKPRSAKNGGPIDPATGRKMYEPTTNATYVNKAGKTVTRKISSTKMAETDDAFTLSSGTPMEAVYATHANRLKALANEARKTDYHTKGTPYSPSAKAAYSYEVDTLRAKLNTALQNSPRERQAQLVGGAIVSAKRKADPNMDGDTLKKVKAQALNDARARVGASKQKITLTPAEWNAVQAGAISNNMLTRILENADLDQIKQLATPRTATVMLPAKVARAKAMMAAGYTQAEVAEQLGVPTSTLNSALG